MTDAEGKVTFKTIVPGCYTGRWPHLHFEVFSSIDDITDLTNAILTSQIEIPQAVCNVVYALDDYAGSAENLAQLTLDTDNIFSDGYDQQLITLDGSVDAGYTSEVLPIPIDTTTEPTAGTVANDAGGQPPAGDMGTPPAPQAMAKSFTPNIWRHSSRALCWGTLMPSFKTQDMT